MYVIIFARDWGQKTSPTKLVIKPSVLKQSLPKSQHKLLWTSQYEDYIEAAQNFFMYVTIFARDWGQKTSPTKLVIKCSVLKQYLLPSASKSFQVLPSASKCFQVLPNASKCFLVLPRASWCFLVHPSASLPQGSFQVFPSASWCFPVLPSTFFVLLDASLCFWVFLCASQCFLVLPSAP